MRLQVPNALAGEQQRALSGELTAQNWEMTSQQESVPLFEAAAPLASRTITVLCLLLPLPVFRNQELSKSQLPPGDIWKLTNSVHLILVTLHNETGPSSCLHTFYMFICVCSWYYISQLNFLLLLYILWHYFIFDNLITSYTFYMQYTNTFYLSFRW